AGERRMLGTVTDLEQREHEQGRCAGAALDERARKRAGDHGVRGQRQVRPMLLDRCDRQQRYGRFAIERSEVRRRQVLPVTVISSATRREHYLLSPSNDRLELRELEITLFAWVSESMLIQLGRTARRAHGSARLRPLLIGRRCT